MQNVIAARKEYDVEYINRVSFVGSVVHKYRPSKNLIILTLAVNGAGAHLVEYPNVTFYGKEMADAIDSKITIDKSNYTRVRIDAYIETSRKTVEGETRYYQNIVGRRISRAPTNMEEITGRAGIGSHKAGSQNEVCLLGTVMNVYPVLKEGADRPSCVSITLRIENDGRINFPHIICFGNQVPIGMALKANDTVCATAFIETTNKDYNGNQRRFESVVVTEIAKVE